MVNEVLHWHGVNDTEWMKHGLLYRHTERQFQRDVTLDTRLFDVPSLTLLVTFDMYSEEDIKSDSAMSSATEPARPRCFPPGDVMHESA